MSAVASRARDDRLRADETVARVTLRPKGPPLPLGALTLVPAGIFCASWLAFALSEMSGSVGKTSSAVGVLFLGCGALFALLMAGGLAGGKAAAGTVILAGSSRLVLSGPRLTAARASAGSRSP